MNKELKKISNLIASVTPVEPATKQRLEDGLEAARIAHETATEAKANAETEAELDAAIDAEYRAKEKEKFFEQQLDKLKFTSHLSDDEYNDALATADKVMKDAAAAYLAIVNRCISEITEAKASYLQTAQETDALLEELDQSSNYLQTKYRYRERNYVGMPSSFTEDRNNWKRYRTRYLTNSAYHPNATAEEMVTGSRKLYAAWELPERGE